MKPGDVPAAVFGDINVVTNCDYVDLFKNDEFVKRLEPKNDKFKYLKHPPMRHSLYVVIESLWLL